MPAENPYRNEAERHHQRRFWCWPEKRYVSEEEKAWDYGYEFAVGGELTPTRQAFEEGYATGLSEVEGPDAR